MGSSGALRGSRRWATLAAVAVLLALVHVLSRFHSSEQHTYSKYVNPAKWDSFFKEENQNLAQHPPLVPPPAAKQQQPEYVSDVSPDKADGVQPSIVQPEPMAGASTPPHRFEHANDFKPLMADINLFKNLTIDQAKEACNWTEDEFMQFYWGSRTSDYIVNQRPEWEVDLIRSRLLDFVQNGMSPYPAKDPYSGRGVVIVGGHPKSLKRVRVLVRALRAVGSKLPVELHYWGEEMDDSAKDSILTEFPSGFYLNDLSDPGNVYQSNKSYNSLIHINYHLKTLALLNSRFAEPLLLDSDNVPVQDPELLWESETYKEYGSVFWPDIIRMQPENPTFAITNTKCRKDEYELESGQLLVNKRKFYYHLQLADWFMTQIYFNQYLLGDKDTFRFAWTTLKTEYGRPSRWVTSVGLNMPREDPEAPDGIGEAYCGHSFAQHHPDSGAVAFMHGGALKSFSAPLLRRLRARGGIVQSYKRSPVDMDWNKIEYGVHLKFMDAAFLYDLWPPPVGEENELRVPKDDEAHVLCTEMQHVETRDANEILPGFYDMWEQAGGYWMIDDEYRSGDSGA